MKIYLIIFLVMMPVVACCNKQASKIQWSNYSWYPYLTGQGHHGFDDGRLWESQNKSAANHNWKKEGYPMTIHGTVICGWHDKSSGYMLTIDTINELIDVSVPPDDWVKFLDQPQTDVVLRGHRRPNGTWIDVTVDFEESFPDGPIINSL